MLFDDTEADARILLDLLLQVLRKLLVALGRDYRQCVDIEAVPPVAILIDAQPQSTPYRLTALPFGAYFTQRANLKHVRVVPSLTQSGARVRNQDKDRASAAR